ncbi:MAG TPA: hypothetical protein VFE04_09540 [Puia sp.]|nr:hypothetical protein [Puia sp.]
MKLAPYFGIGAALLLVLFCFIPWAYYPDIQQNFTGFYSKGNNYGKPGKTLIFLSLLSIAFFFIPTLWAKRANQFTSVLIFSYALKSYLLFSACYLGICPQTKIGLYGMLICSIFILICSLFSRAPIKREG